MVPLPESAAVGVFEALEATLSVPVRLPATVGVKITLIVQVLPEVSDDPQSPDCPVERAKSPLRPGVRPVTSLAPVLLTVTLLALLEDEISCEPKLSATGLLGGLVLSERTGGRLVPLRDTVRGVVLEEEVIDTVPV